MSKGYYYFQLYEFDCREDYEPNLNSLVPQTGPDHFRYNMLYKKFWSERTIEKGRPKKQTPKLRGRPATRRPVFANNITESVAIGRERMKGTKGKLTKNGKRKIW